MLPFHQANRPSRPARNAFRPRKAFAVVVVLVAIAVVAAVATEAATSLRRVHQENRHYLAQLQTRALARSAWHFTRQQRQANPEHRLTEWSIPQGDLPQPDWSAEVRVALQPGIPAARWIIEVTLRDGAGTISRYRQLVSYEEASILEDS